MKEIKTIYDQARKQRVIIFRRENGTYGFEDQLFSDEPLEQTWMPQGRYSESFCDTAERAELEARGRVKWLAQLSGTL